MPSGSPTSAYCRWPPDGPDLLLNAATIGFELAQPLFKMATGTFPRCCRLPSDGPSFLQSGSTNNLSWPSPLQTGCCRWYGVGRWQDDADGPLMARSFSKAVTDGIGLACHKLLPMIRWPAALQKRRANSFELALLLSNDVLPTVWGWPIARHRRWPLDGPGLFHNSDTDSIEMANHQMLPMTL